MSPRKTTTSSGAAGAPPAGVGASSGSAAPQPATPPAKKGTAARAMAAAPLVLAGLAQVGVIGHGGAAPSLTGTLAVKCGTGITDYQTCHDRYPTGCSAGGAYDGYLNSLKNELIEPTTEPQLAFDVPALIQLEGKLPAELGPTNHEALKDAIGALGEGEVSSLKGYLYYAKNGGGESSNCGLQGAENIDFHIGIGPDAAAASRAKKPGLTVEERHAAVIVEMTPHWRAENQPGWTLAQLTKAVGRQVYVVGQLLADNEHHDAKDDCAYSVPPKAGCWRPTVWELHPVTRFLVCDGDCSGDPSATPTPAGWTPLEKFNPPKDGTAAAASQPPPPPAAPAAPNAKASPAPQKP
jgi:hypothetical protein